MEMGVYDVVAIVAAGDPDGVGLDEVYAAAPGFGPHGINFLLNVAVGNGMLVKHIGTGAADRPTFTVTPTASPTVAG